MRYLRIQSITDDVTGELGFNIKGNNLSNDGQYFVSGDGLLIAHDIIEHQQGIDKIGVTLEDEIIAFGGIIYTRGMTGNLGSPMLRPEESLGIELADFFRYYNDIKITTKHYPKKWDYEELCEFDFIFDTVNKMKKILNENSYEEYYSEEDNKKELLNPYIEWIRHHLKYGVYLAHKRYGCNYKAMTMFKCIQDEVNRFSPSFEGEEFILGYQSDIAVMRPLEEYEYE